MAILEVDMYQTMAIAVGVLLLGSFLTRKVKLLARFCVPAPVVGGLIFAIFTCICYVNGVVDFHFDDSLKNVAMVLFFTSVGFQANLKVLKQGGVALAIFLVVIIALIFSQNIVAVGVSNLLGLDPMLGLATGSIPMVGGHGTSGAFGPILEDFGVVGGTTICTAAATFGLIAGSLMGGPLGRNLIEKRNLLSTAVASEEEPELLYENYKLKDTEPTGIFRHYPNAVFMLIAAAGVGTIVSSLLSKTGMTFPVYVGAMIVAAVIRNVSEQTGKFRVHMDEINSFGGICLSLFLGMAMITLKIWQLADLALPLIILLAVQVVLMFIFARFIVFNVMRRDYDAAVLAAGTCGFGMGATPNAMANMQAICNKYVPSVKAYLLVPIVGSLFADFINSITITFFINIF